MSPFLTTAIFTLLTSAVICSRFVLAETNKIWGFVGLIANGQVLVLGHRFSIIYVLSKALDLSPDLPDGIQTNGGAKGRGSGVVVKYS